jgi:small conductance mechanosensitive channel
MLESFVKQAEAAVAEAEPAPWYSLEAIGGWLLGIVPSAITALLLLFATLLCASWLQRIVRTAAHRARIEETLARFFGKLARWAVLTVGILLILGEFGIETASFAVVIGALGLAVGLALQGTLGNFAAGVLLLVFRPYKVGDVVVVAGNTGKVDEIDLFCTTLDTVDNRRIIVPNGAILGGTIENITHHPLRRADVTVGVDYSAAVDATRAALERAAASVPERHAPIGHQVVLLGLGASSVDWQVRVWCKTEDYFACLEATVGAIKQSLESAGVAIPFPQLEVRLKDGDGRPKSV